MPNGRDEAMWRRLSEYHEMSTSSAFSQAFCWLIAEYVAQDGPAHAVGELFTKFLSREVRYCREVERLRTREALNGEDIQSLGAKRSIALLDIVEQARVVSAASAEGEIARQLLLAECYYRMQKPGPVIGHLERALAEGADDPLVHFALGCNRYYQALASLGNSTEAVEDKGHDGAIADFQLSCLQAVSAFEKALTGEDSDGEVHEWIGQMLQAAGFGEAAARAFDKAAELAHTIGDNDESDLTPPDTDRPGRLLTPGLGPITEAEIEQVGDLFRQRHEPTDVWPEAGRDYDR